MMQKKLCKMVQIWISVICFCVLFSVIAKAENLYEKGDIDRVYITCDTEIGQLTKEDYVTAKVDIVKADGTVDVSDDAAQVKLRGNSTSKAAKKPLKFKFSSKISFLGMDKGKKWNVLANAFDKTLIRNALCFELGDKMGLSYICQGRFVDLYYNGKLCGSYYVTEPVETGTGRVEINEEEKDFMIELERERFESDVQYIYSKLGLRFAVNAPEIPTSTQTAYMNSYLANVETAFSTYKMSEYSKYIDVDSFVNYYIVSEIFKAVDFNYSSTRFYVKDGKMYAGPLWDVDLSSGNASSKFYRDYYKDGVSYKDLYCTQMRWFGYLMKSDEFVEKVNARLQQMLSTIQNMYQNNQNGTSRIDTLMQLYGPSFERNYLALEQGGAGWSITERYSLCDNRLGLEYDNHPATYKENVELLREWLKNRVNYLQSQWKATINNKINGLEAKKKSYNSILLSWYQQGVADGYEIEYKVEKENYKLLKVIENGNTQELKAKKLTPGLKYTFRVRSYVKNGNTKTYSPYASVKKTLKLNKPKVKAKRINRKKAKVTWKKVKGAKGYIVYMSLKKSGKYKKVKTIHTNKKLQYVKKNCRKNKKYYFRVKSYVVYNGKKYISK